MRAPSSVIVSLMLAATAASPAAAQDQPDPNVNEIAVTVTRMFDEDWHPLLNDPLWLDLKPRLDAEAASRPTGDVAMLARRAALRADITVDPVVSAAAPFLLDTRPWFDLATELPYFVEIRAALDSEPAITLAAAFSGAQCGARTTDIAWPQAISPGFHRLSLSAEISYLRRAMPSKRPCAFLVRGATMTTMTTDDWPQPSSSQVLAQERRPLPGIAFGLFDNPPEDPFVLAAKRTRAAMLDPLLPNIPFERWMMAGVPPVSEADSQVISWLLDFCDEDEALWYHVAKGQTAYWRASSAARKRRRELCVTALAETGGVSSHLVGVRIAVATILEDDADWQLIAPRLYEAFIDGWENSLEVPTLSQLPQLVTLPEYSWPRVDLSVTPSDVTLDPPEPQSGQPVTMRVNVHNMGGRTVRRALIIMDIAPCCHAEVGVWYHRLADVPVNGMFTMERTLMLPACPVEMTFCAFPWPPEGRKENLWRRFSFLDSNPTDNCLINEKIGQLRPRNQ